MLLPLSLPCSPDPQKQWTGLRERCLCCPESDSHSTGGSEEDRQGHRMMHGQVATGSDDLVITRSASHLETGLLRQEGLEDPFAAADAHRGTLRLEVGAQQVVERLTGDVVPQ